MEELKQVYVSLYGVTGWEEHFEELKAMKNVISMSYLRFFLVG